MAQIEYLGTYGNTKTYDEPSGIVRRIRDKNLYTIEICNEGTPWREEADLIRHFMGFTDTAYPISAEKANRIISAWQKNWFS